MQQEQYFIQSIIKYYNNQARVLPWRESPTTPITPYHTLVSEVMLQQTQIGKVIDYFKRFLQKFPTITSLAQASQEEVHLAWSGLGYYRRATNLHKAAKQIALENTFPNTIEALGKLPGIGAYTSRSIASIAFSVPAIALDTNAIRVISRYFHLHSLTLKQLQNWSDEHLIPFISPREASSFTQGIMDFGSMLCKAKKPLCDSCPLATSCLAHEQQDYQTSKALGSSQKKIRNVQWTFYLFTYQDSVLMWNTDQTQLYQNLWTFPWQEDKKSPYQDWLNETLSNRKSDLNWSFPYRVTTKKVRATAKVFTLEASLSPPFYHRWEPLSELHQNPHSSLVKKILKGWNKEAQS